MRLLSEHWEELFSPVMSFLTLGACAVRVTVLGLCVCLSVCYRYSATMHN